MSVLVDTDALIAVANTSLWDDVKRVEVIKKSRFRKSQFPNPKT